MFELSIAKSAIYHFVTRIGTAVLGFIGTLYAARALGPSPLGTYSLFFSLVLVGNLVTDLGINSAARKRISERGSDPKSLITAALSMKLAIFLIIVSLLFIFSGHVESYLGEEGLVPLLILALFLFILQTSVVSLLEGRRRVGTSGFINFVQNLVRVGAWVALLTIGYGLFGLIFGYLVGLIAAITLGYLLMPVMPKLPGLEDFKSLLSFSVYSIIGSVKSMSVSWTDTIILGFFVSSSVIGTYNVAWNLSYFFLFASFSLSKSLFPNISKMGMEEREQVEEVTAKALAFTGTITIPGFIGSIVLGDAVLNIYGNAFVAGHTVLIILALGSVIQSYEQVLLGVCDGLDRPDLTFKTNSTFVLTNIGLNSVFIQFWGGEGAAVATTISILLSGVLIYRYLEHLIDIRTPRKEIGFQIIAALIMGAALIPIVGMAGNVGIAETIGLIFLGVAVYGLSLTYLSEMFRKTMREHINIPVIFG